MSASACSDFLDQQPLSEVNAGNFFRSKIEVDASMSGLYSAFQMQMNGDGQYLERYNFWGDYRSDNFERFFNYTTTTTTELHFNTITADNPFADWTGMYNVISRANNNIKYIPEVAKIDATLTPAIANQYLAESYALRAISYFYIVRVWGDAPIWTEPYPVEDLNTDPSRPREASAKIINEVIIKDLESAYGLITKNQTPVVWNMSEGAICAMMADVYMWNKDYPNAIIWINRLFAAKAPTGAAYAGTSDANLEPTATWKNIFTSPAASREAIWSLHWNYTDNGCACLEISYTPNNKQIRVDPDLFTKYFLPATTTAATGDIRPKQTLDLYTVANRANNNRDRFVKWYQSPVNPTATTTTAQLNTYFTQNHPVYLPMYRLGDIYLLYAEALNGDNNLPGALRYLNYIRKRAGLPEYVAANPAVSTKAAMENTILQERQYELIGEGKRWFDLVRTGKVKEIMDPVLKRRQAEAGSEQLGFADNRRVYWPVSRSVLNSNKKLVQNPGYTD